MCLIARQAENVLEIVFVHGKDIIAGVKVVSRKLPYDVVYFYSMFTGDSKSPRIGYIANMIIGRSARVDIKQMLQISAFHLMLKDGLGQGRPADVPEADK